MSKMSTERARIALNGPTMGTRWSALLFADPGFDPGPVRSALQAAVDEVDGQMSTWKPDSLSPRCRYSAALGSSSATRMRIVFSSFRLTE